MVRISTVEPRNSLIDLPSGPSRKSTGVSRRLHAPDGPRCPHTYYQYARGHLNRQITRIQPANPQRIHGMDH
jgi:hypothetical protein